MTSKCKHNEVCARWSATGHNMIHALRNINVLTVEKSMHRITKKCSFYKREYDIQHIRVSHNVSFF